MHCLCWLKQAPPPLIETRRISGVITGHICSVRHHRWLNIWEKRGSLRDRRLALILPNEWSVWSIIEIRSVQLRAGSLYFYDAQRDDIGERFYHTTAPPSNLIISSILSVQSLGKICSLSLHRFLRSTKTYSSFVCLDGRSALFKTRRKLAQICWKTSKTFKVYNTHRSPFWPVSSQRWSCVCDLCAKSQPISTLHVYTNRQSQVRDAFINGTTGFFQSRRWMSKWFSI